MLASNVRFLICPHCGEGFAHAEGSLRCGSGHSFDIARQGYVSLLGGKGRSVPGDTADMVQARARFLDAGHFAPVADAVARAGVRELAREPRGLADSRGCIVDIGAGTGHYLHTLAARLASRERERYGLIAVDVSKQAMRVAVRLHPELAAVVSDVRHMIPVASSSAELVVDAFAPRELDEIDRVLSPDGCVLVVVPHGDHLAELVDALGLLRIDPGKRTRTESKLSETFLCVDEEQVSYAMSLHHDEVLDLVRMGPSAWHQSADESAKRLRTLPDPTVVSVSVSVLTYRRGYKETVP